MATNLTRIGNTYYAILIIPVKHRDRLGRSKFQKTLSTGNLSLARQRAAPLLSVWRELINTDDDYRQRAIELRRLYSPTAPRAEALEWYEAQSDLLTSVLTSTPTPHTVQAATEIHSITSGRQVLLGTYREQYRTYLQVKSKPSTVQTRIRDIDLFLQTFQSPDAVGKQSLLDWYQVLRNQGKSDNSINRVLIAVREFWSLVAEQVEMSDVVFRLPKLSAVQSTTIDRVPFTSTELQQLLDTPSNSKYEIELKQIIRIGMYSGLRIEEICQLRKGDIRTDSGILYFDVKQSKTAAGIRKVPIHHKLLTLVQELGDCKADLDYLFDLTADRNGRRSNAISQAFTAHKVSMGMPPSKVFHSIRHGFNTALMVSGEVLKVNQIMGHANSVSNKGVSTYWHGYGLQELSELINTVVFLQQ